MINNISFQEYSKALMKETAEKNNAYNRAIYLDAYRKYQAAVNYGEFERVAAIDSFVEALRNKDWTVLDNVSSQLKYFTGEVGFAESGLVRKLHD